MYGRFGLAGSARRIGWKPVLLDCQLSFRLEPQLPAGGGDVVAFFAAQRGDYFLLFEGPQERLLRRITGPLPGKSFERGCKGSN